MWTCALGLREEVEGILVLVAVIAVQGHAQLRARPLHEWRLHHDAATSHVALGLPTDRAKRCRLQSNGRAPSKQSFEFFHEVLEPGVTLMDRCCDCAFRGRPYQRCVLCEDTGFVTGGRRFPFRHAARDFGVGYFKFQPSDLGVDGDLVAFANGGYRTAQCRFWSYVADHQTSGCAAEASVGDQGYAFTETFAHNRRGHAQHLAHARAAFWTFIADHHHVSSFDLLAGHRLHRGFFGIEDARWAGVGLAFVATHLYYSAAGSQVTLQDD